MKIAILGYGDQGVAAYEYWGRDGNEITICDKDVNLQVPAGVSTQLGNDYLKDLGRFELLVRTPALHPRDIVEANSEDILQKVTSVTNEFFKVCPTKNIIGVTGTKGKGTTSTLIAKMLEASGKRVHLGGNIGIPPLDMLNPPAGGNIQPDDWVVLELANFQLIDLKYSPHIAVCLMVEPEHMDWHGDMNEYITAKKQMFIHQKPDDIAIYYANNDNSSSVADASLGKQIPYYETPGAFVADHGIHIDGNSICKTSELKLLGKHNWQNVCAAVTAVWVALNPAKDQTAQLVDAIRSVLTSFEGLEHRLEFVREIEGIKFYDDSFGTTPETAIVAIEAFEQPKVVILGGSDKGAQYDKLALAVKNNNVRAVIIIGQTGPAIADALRTVGFELIIDGGNTITDIVNAAKSIAQAGDVILLSTGCASFGLFKNYKDRGDQFKQAVQELV